MHRALLYSLFTLFIAGACVAEYLGLRLLSFLPDSLQKRIAVGSLVICIPALAIFHTNMVATDCLVLLIGLMAGVLLGRVAGSVATLSSMLIVASIADLISTHAGPTKWLVDESQRTHLPLLQLLALSLRLNGAFIPVIGVGDLMFFTACASAVRRFGWGEMPALLIPLAGILCALALALLARITAPAIPFLAAAVLIYSLMRGRGTGRLSRDAPHPSRRSS